MNILKYKSWNNPVFKDCKTLINLKELAHRPYNSQFIWGPTGPSSSMLNYPEDMSGIAFDYPINIYVDNKRSDIEQSEGNIGKHVTILRLQEEWHGNLYNLFTIFKERLIAAQNDTNTPEDIKQMIGDLKEELITFIASEDSITYENVSVLHNPYPYIIRICGWSEPHEEGAEPVSYLSALETFWLGANNVEWREYHYPQIQNIFDEIISLCDRIINDSGTLTPEDIAQLREEIKLKAGAGISFSEEMLLYISQSRDALGQTINYLGFLFSIIDPISSIANYEERITEMKENVINVVRDLRQRYAELYTNYSDSGLEEADKILIKASAGAVANNAFSFMALYENIVNKFNKKQVL